MNPLPVPHSLPRRTARLAQWLATACMGLAFGLWPGLAGAQLPTGSLPSAASTSGPPSADSVMPGGGPVRLREAVPGQPSTRSDSGTTSAVRGSEQRGNEPAAQRHTEFERHVMRLSGGLEVHRLGTELLSGNDDASGGSPLVPADYLVQPGDEIVLTMWGSVEADLHLMVDRAGRISVPRVGTVMVAGVRYADLADTISKRVAMVFKNFSISVSLGQLRGMRVFVTGFVARPGLVMVNSLTTISQALLRAGGPAVSGSFRDVQLRRGREPVIRFDLYDLLLSGDRSNDRVLQPDDVIHVGPIGPQVALIGSVNRPAIFELKPNERLAGGLAPVADGTRLLLERIGEREGAQVVDLAGPESERPVLRNGDVLRALNIADLTQAIGPQRKRVRVEGEVLRPGQYLLAPGSTIADALAAAGGLTGNAYLFGTEFNRESVRATQAQNYERALRDFETELVRAPVAERAATADEAAARTATADAGTRLLEKLRAVRPTGRLVLQSQPGTTSLPELTLEDRDRIYVPPRPTTIGVFGSVFSAGSYLHNAGRTVGDYLRLAGGPTRRADESSVFVVRANGTVTSSLAESGFFSRGNQIAGLVTEPGDTIFVPDAIARITWTQAAKDWTQILYQFGLGIAGLKSALN